MYEVFYNLTKQGVTLEQTQADMQTAAQNTPHIDKLRMKVAEGKILHRSVYVNGDTFTSKQVWVSKEEHDAWDHEIRNDPSLMSFHTNLQGMGYQITITTHTV